MMHIEAIKTRLMMPPQDDLYEVLAESIDSLPEESILVITSKVLAIHQGRCLLKDDYPLNEALMQQESAFYMKLHGGRKWMAMRNDAIMPYAGVDPFGEEYWVLAPDKLAQTTHEIHQWLLERFAVQKLGVMVADSVIWPLRRGTLGISLASAGFCPLENYDGTLDLLGRPYIYTYINQIDALAAAAVVVMGETVAQTPLALIRDVPFITFGDCPDHVPPLGIPPHLDPLARILTHRAWKRGALAPPGIRVWARLQHWLSGYVWRWRQWRETARRKTARRKDVA